MILKHITLHNIRSYLDEKIIFPKGSVLLCGDIGSGKSTILLAIEFALFGLKRGELGGSSLLRNGKNEGSIELKFSLMKKEIIIKRILKRTSTSIKQEAGYIVVDNQKTEGTPVELKSKVFELLGYPKELVSKSKDLVFRYTVYTPQEEMKYILFANKDERLDILRRVFNIDRYKRIRDNLQVAIREIREKSKEYKGMVFSLPEKETQRKDIMKDINTVIQEAKKLIPLLKDSKEKITELATEFSELEEKEKKLMESRKNLELKEQAIRNLEEQKENYGKEEKKIVEDIKKLKKKIEDFAIEDISFEKMNEDISTQEEAIEKLEKELAEKKENNVIITEKIKSLKENIRLYSKETASRRGAEKQVLEKKQELKNLLTVIKHREELEKNTEKVQKILERISSIVTEKEVNMKNSESIMENIKEINVCPTCHQDVSEEYKKKMREEGSENIKRLKAELEDMNLKKDEYAERLRKTKENLKTMMEKEKLVEKTKAEIESLDKSFSEFDMKKTLITEYEEKAKSLESKLCTEDILNALKESVQEKKNVLKSLKEKSDRIKEKNFLEQSMKEKIQRMDEIKEYLKSYKEKRKELFGEKTSVEEEIEGLKDVEENVESAKKKLEEMKEKDKQLEIKKAEIIKERNTLAKQKESIENEINEMKKIEEKISILKETKTWLSDYFNNLSIVIEKHIMQRVYHEFNELFKEWFSMLMESDIINVRLDEEFTPIIEQNGYETEVDNLSGGEKTSLALSYRLALNKVINDCIEDIRTKEILILDEPTDGFSSEQLDKIREVLDEINIPQVIIVSHEPKIESFVDSIVRIQKDEHVSSVV